MNLHVTPLSHLEMSQLLSAYHLSICHLLPAYLPDAHGSSIDLLTYLPTSHLCLSSVHLSSIICVYNLSISMVYHLSTITYLSCLSVYNLHLPPVTLLPSLFITCLSTYHLSLIPHYLSPIVTSGCTGWFQSYRSFLMPRLETRSFPRRPRSHHCTLK